MFIVNDDITLAKQTKASGVHLGREDASVADAREQLGPQAIIGVSCYNELTRAETAQAQGADYIAFGRFFPSRTKPQAVQANPDLLREAKKKLHIPVVAIGGITPENGAALIAAGADALAVIEGVFGQPDIRAAAERYARLFKNGRQEYRINRIEIRRLDCSAFFLILSLFIKTMTTSSDLFKRAQKCIPGGVNSPVRAFKGVGGDPVFFARGQGAYVFDADGKRYIDYVGSWGPMILGHAHPEVMRGGAGSRRQRPELRRTDAHRRRTWPIGSANWCPPWTWCAWSVPAPRPP